MTVNLFRRSMVAFLIALGVVAGGLVPATATPSLSGGTGVSTHLGVPYTVPTPPLQQEPCAVFTRYQAEVVFGTTSATVASTTAVWAEGPGGTYAAPQPQVDPLEPLSIPCGSGPTAEIGGFVVTLTGPTACVAAPATYERTDITITVRVTGNGISGSCAGTVLTYTLAGFTTSRAIPPFFQAGDYVAACAPIIAPAACVIGDEQPEPV